MPWFCGRPVNAPIGTAANVVVSMRYSVVPEWA